MRPTRRFARLAPLVLMVAWVGSGSPRTCGAEEAAASEAPWYQEISVNGFLSSSYSYNFNRPSSGTNGFRVFDFDDNAFKVDVLELAIQKPVSRPRDAGFRADLVFGSSIPRVSAAAGLFRDGAGNAEDVDLQQVYASYVVPLRSGLKVDLGKFVTSLGFEVIEGYDGWNDNATRSLLFGYAIPFTHTGVRAGYAFSPRVSGSMMIVNGWDNARDDNRPKSVGAQLALTPAPPISVVLSIVRGPERRANNSDPRTVLDGVAIWKPRERLTVGVNGDWGSEARAGPAGGDARWSGVAGYVRVRRHEGCALTLRAEVFDDRDGVRTGVVQTLRELTLTPEKRLTPHLMVRADLRIDHSNHAVFEDDGGPRDTQATFLLNALYSF
jgi:hypothetical protein